MRRARKTVAAEVVRSDSVLARMRAACPWLFLVLCLASSMFQAWNVPPFQGPDELAHAYRVDLTTFGQLTAKRVHKKDTVAGGPADMSLYEAMVPFDPLRFHAEEKVDVADFARGETALWDGRTTETGYPGSAIYPPFFYLPQAWGLAVGKLFDLPVVQSLFLARTANALACSLLGFVALLMAGRSRLLMFSVLLLPMSVFLYSTVTNDGMMVVVTALAVAPVARAVHEGRPMRRAEVIASTICFALVGATKAPYTLMGLVLLASDMEKPRWRWISTGAVFAAAILWTLWMTLLVQTAILAGNGVDPALQVEWILTHPMGVAQVAWNTMTLLFTPYTQMFIGVLGWLDVSLPQLYHHMAWTILGLSVVASASVGRGAGWRALPAVTAAALVLTFGAIHGALYVTWNTVAHEFVTGVQGRYFLPLALLLCLALEGERPMLPQNAVAAWVSKALVALVLAFPLVSLLIVQHAVIVRYYLD
jgi:uncharacterized membrane protein